MTKSNNATSATGRTAEELKIELRRLVKTIVDDDDVKVDVFDEACKDLMCLKDIKFGLINDKIKKNGTGSIAVPENFLCPISAEIMVDPVILSTGQTYDRHFIQEWLNSGNRTCPKSHQVLTSPTLIPNLLIRNMISQWCTEHGVPLSSPMDNNPDEPHIPSYERRSLISLLNNLSSPSTPTKNKAVKDLRMLTRQKTSARAFIGKNPEAITKLLSLDNDVQEDVVTTILNLSIFENNKKVLGDNSKVIPFLIEAIESGAMKTRANAAAAIFSLSALDSNKVKIGELGATKALIELLENGTLDAKKDAANAIFNLCTNYENKTRAVGDNLATVLMSLIMDKVLVGELLTILALVSGYKRVAEEIVEIDGVQALLAIVRESTCARNKENAIVVIYSICVDHRMKLKEVGEEESFRGSISDLASNGTSRARRKANGILERIRKMMHITHYSC